MSEMARKPAPMIARICGVDLPVLLAIALAIGCATFAVIPDRPVSPMTMKFHLVTGSAA